MTILVGSRVMVMMQHNEDYGDTLGGSIGKVGYIPDDWLYVTVDFGERIMSMNGQRYLLELPLPKKKERDDFADLFYPSLDQRLRKEG